MSAKTDLLEAVMVSVPYSQHITDLDLESDSDAIRFTWRGDRFRVSERMAESVKGDFLHGDNAAILMESIVKRGLVSVYERRNRKP